MEAMETDRYLDEAFLPMFRHLVETTAVDQAAFNSEEAGFALKMEELSLEMPVEMDVYVDNDGTVHIGSVPPLYYANTSLQPVYHKIQVTVAQEKEVIRLQPADEKEIVTDQHNESNGISE